MDPRPAASNEPPLRVVGAGELAGILRRERGWVVDAWCARVLADPAVPEANALAAPLLRDHIPDVIERLASALERMDGTDRNGEVAGRSVGGGVESKEHARDRFFAGYSMTAVLRELSQLRVTLIDLCAAQRVTIDAETAAAVQMAIDGAMATAAVEIDDAARQATEIEKERLRRVLQLLPVGVFLSDAEGRLLDANEQARAIWSGAPLVEATDRYDAYEAYWAGTNRRLSSPEWALARALRERQVVGPQELEIRGFEGERRVILNSAAPVTDDAGHVVGGVAVNVDITEQKRIEDELRHVADMRERFLAILGHDLRTPLSAIAIGANLLLRAPDVPPAHLDVVRRIARSASRMERMVAALLDVALVRQGGGIPISPAPARLDEIVRAVLDEVELAYPDRAFELHVTGACEGVWDRDRLTQVVSNLVTNALDHGAPDQPVTVTIDGSRADVVSFAVANAGDPIPPEIAARIFDPFERGEPAEGRSGLGLGLYIACAVVRAHGGTIRLDPARTDGATFVVELPREGTDARQ